MPKRPTYEITFARDFTLAMIEIWGRAEATNKKLWTSKAQPYSPYIVFERTQETVRSFYDVRGIAWSKQELVRQIQTDRMFLVRLEKVIRETSERLGRQYWSRSPLSLSGLRDFLASYEVFWSWFEGAWWIWELSPEESAGVEIPESFKKLREDTQDEVPKSEALIRHSLETLYPHMRDFVDVISTEEIKTGNIVPVEILKKRKQNYYFVDNILYVDTTKDFIEKKYGVTLEEFEGGGGTREIKGQVAYRGKVTGTVRILFGPKQMEKVGEGDIIVAPMTLPDILPAMKKAAAFITDEGGVICHAAIMARELKKPCIIGTKIATKMLKDGDRVEVNADTGVVTIIQ